MARSYTSPVRDQRKADTRRQILDALVDVILNDGVHAFSVQAVATRAGVSHRTVYRHFPSRDALLEGLSADLAAFSEATGLPGMPEDIDSLPDLVVSTFERFDDTADALTAYITASLAIGHETTLRRERSRAFQRAIDRAYPDLDPDVTRRAFAVLRTLASSRAWLTFRGFGLDGHEAGEAVAWAVRVLITDLRDRNELARARHDAGES